MKKIFIISTVLLTVLACNKDKFETKPHLEFKSFNTDVVEQSNSLRATLQFTDQEGDLDSIYVIRQRLNKKASVTMPAARYGIPEFNGEKKGDLFLTLNYSIDLTFGMSPIRIPGSNPVQNEPDTLQLRFVLKDKAGNKSDTATSSVVYVKR